MIKYFIQMNILLNLTFFCLSWNKTLIIICNADKIKRNPSVFHLNCIIIMLTLFEFWLFAHYYTCKNVNLNHYDNGCWAKKKKVTKKIKIHRLFYKQSVVEVIRYFLWFDNFWRVILFWKEACILKIEVRKNIIRHSKFNA